MDQLSRRKFLTIFASLSLSYPLSLVYASAGKNKAAPSCGFPVTNAVLKAAYEEEKMAYEHYKGYCRKAIEEKYPNIAYLFTTFAISEKIHAQNYKRLMTSMNTELREPEFDVLILDTKTNLIKATEGELKKIKKNISGFTFKTEKRIA